MIKISTFVLTSDQLLRTPEQIGAHSAQLIQQIPPRDVVCVPVRLRLHTLWTGAKQANQTLLLTGSTNHTSQVLCEWSCGGYLVKQRDVEAGKLFEVDVGQVQGGLPG